MCVCDNRFQHTLNHACSINRIEYIINHLRTIRNADNIVIHIKLNCLKVKVEVCELLQFLKHFHYTIFIVD